MLGMATLLKLKISLKIANFYKYVPKIIHSLSTSVQFPFLREEFIYWKRTLPTHDGINSTLALSEEFIFIETASEAESMVPPEADFGRELVQPRAGGADTCRHENKFRASNPLFLLL